MTTVADDIDEAPPEVKPARAGFSASRKKKPDPESTPGDDDWVKNLFKKFKASADFVRKDPDLGVPPSAKATSSSPTLTPALLAAAWGQKNVDTDAYNLIRHWNVVSENPLVICEPGSDDQLQLGTDSDGSHTVLGKTNITAAEAYNRISAGLTSRHITKNGIERLEGMEKDQALLMLAAKDRGIPIHNMPDISPEVMTAALMEWTNYKAGLHRPALTDKFSEARRAAAEHARPRDADYKETSLPILKLDMSADGENLQVAIARAYKAAKAVPEGTTVGLAGSARDRVILYLAAYKCDLKVSPSHVPSKEDVRESKLSESELMAAWDEFEKAQGLKEATADMATHKAESYPNFTIPEPQEAVDPAAKRAARAKRTPLLTLSPS